MADANGTGSVGGGGARVFATTHWSLVVEAAGDSGGASEALERLCRAYWYPIYAHVRRKGHGPDDAQDLTQEFFAGLLRRGSFASARREKGRFRTFLLGALDHFLADQSDRERAAKRGGGTPTVALDALEAEQRYALEPRTDETPDREFDRRWAMALMERAFARLAAEQTADGAARFARLRPLLGREVEAGEYEAIGADLGVAPNTLAAAVRRWRLRLRELALEEAAHTLASPLDAEAELRLLLGG